MSERPIRVIIVGAGPTGLYLAGALAKANIDFIVLEQHHSIVNHAGAGILVWPHSTRLIDQLGLFGAVKEHDTNIDAKMDLLLDGRVTRNNPLFGLLDKRFGYPTIACSRSELIQLLYEGIPDRENRVKPNSRIVDIETNSEGVKVHLHNGTVEEGSIVVGVDGVHSKTRETVERLSGTPAVKPAMVTTFYGIYGKATSIDRVAAKVFYESRGTGKVCQMFRCGNKMHYAFLKTLKAPTAERKTYDADEMERLAEEFAEHYVAPGVKFKDVWAATDKTTARLVNQEEGFAEKWYHQRIVLVGDAVHKMTSVTGQGVNCGMHSAASFANELRRTLASNPHPTTEQLEEAFVRYQKTREDESRALVSQSLMATRLITWSSWRGWFWDRYIAPWFDAVPLFEKFSQLISAGQILDYVPFAGNEGSMPWLRKAVSQA